MYILLFCTLPLGIVALAFLMTLNASHKLQCGGFIYALLENLPRIKTCYIPFEGLVKYC